MADAAALPVGRHANAGPDDVRDAVGERYRWLCETVAADPDSRARACCRNCT